jgi:hypothetical protein
MDENPTADDHLSLSTTFRGGNLPHLTTEVDESAVTGRPKRSRTESFKLRENREFQDAIRAVSSTKVRHALSDSTNQSITIDGEDAEKSFSTSSSNNASTNAYVHTDSSSVSTISAAQEKPPSNVDRLRQKPPISLQDQLSNCNFNNPQSVNEWFPTQKGKGQCNCPPAFINKAVDATGKASRVRLWRSYSPKQQLELIKQIYSKDAISAPITSRKRSVVNTSDNETQEQPPQKRWKSKYNVARNLSANEVPFGELGDVDDPFSRVLASEERNMTRQEKKKVNIHYYLCSMTFNNNLLMIHTS